MYLVSDEESGDVIIAGKGIYNGFEVGVLSPCPCGIRLLNLGGERIDVEEQVDASIGECLHAAIMVARGIDMVR